MNAYLIHISILLLSFTSHKSTAQPLHKTLVAPIHKDTKTSLYTITFNSTKPYLIDLTSPFSWHHCPSHNISRIGCFTSECIQADYLPSSCSLITKTSNPCTCKVRPINPISKSCSIAPLTTTNFKISLTNGSNPTSIQIYLSCAPASLLRSLPRGVVVLASLSRAPLGLASQFSQSIVGISEKIGLCLPSSGNTNGIVFFGDGPYDLLSSPRTNLDVTSFLAYTPLLINPKSSDFAIGINALSIGGDSFPMSPFTGIKLSVSMPYTALRTDIYKFLVESFVKGMKGIPKVKKVEPFSLCFKASAIGFSRVGLRVPRIDLEFGGGKNWTIYGSNSMKMVGKDTACFAFLDGGEMPLLPIVLGSFQMEDNFLLFDLDQLRLGFSSSLLFERISCSNFDFTVKA